MTDDGRREGPAVDCVVVTWNSVQHIGACIDSLRRQRGVKVGITVVDNASGDGSADAAVRSDTTVVGLRVNVGFTRGVNLGLTYGNAPYVLLCNPDCDADQDAVARLVRVLEENPEIGAVAPVLIGMDGRPQRMIYRYPRLSDAFFCFTEIGQRLDRRLGYVGERRYGFAEPPGGVAGAVERPSGAFLLVRRRDAESSLDDAFPIFFSDTELCWRLHAQGKKIWCEPAAAVRHVQGASIRKMRGTAILHELQRGLRRFYRLHGGPIERLTFDSLLIVDLAVRIGARALRRRSLAVARAELDLLRRLMRDQPAPDAPWIEGPAADAAVAAAAAPRAG